MENLTQLFRQKRSWIFLYFFKKLKICVKKITALEKDDYETKESIDKFKNIKIIEQINKGYGNVTIEGINNVSTDYCCIINVIALWIQNIYIKCYWSVKIKI